MSREKQIRKIQIDANGRVKIGFVELVEVSNTISDADGNEEGEEGNVIANEFTIKSPNRPHQDFLDALKLLRKFALEQCEMIFETKALTFYTVTGINIFGDVAMKQSRVVLEVSKEVKRTGKFVKFKTPQCTMYGESEYERAEEMSAQIEKVLEEAEQYLLGKFETGIQIPLFPSVELQTN